MGKNQFEYQDKLIVSAHFGVFTLWGIRWKQENETFPSEFVSTVWKALIDTPNKNWTLCYWERNEFQHQGNSIITAFFQKPLMWRSQTIVFLPESIWNIVDFGTPRNQRERKICWKNLIEIICLRFALHFFQQIYMFFFQIFKIIGFFFKLLKKIHNNSLLHFHPKTEYCLERKKMTLIKRLKLSNSYRLTLSFTFKKEDCVNEYLETCKKIGPKEGLGPTTCGFLGTRTPHI